MKTKNKSKTKLVIPDNKKNLVPEIQGVLQPQDFDVQDELNQLEGYRDFHRLEKESP